MSPFTPTGDRARWRILYELVKTRDVGDIITYDEMGAALGVDPATDRTVIQLAFRRAAREFLVHNMRATDVIPNTGYRIVEATEHLGLAQRQQRRAGRAIAASRSVLDHVDWSRVTDPEARKALELAGVMIARQQDMMARMDIRQRRLEEVVDVVAAHADRTDAEMDDLRARLARLEART